VYATAESVTLLNVTSATVDLAGWTLSDRAGGRQVLSGDLQPGVTRRLQLTTAVQLGNQGDAIRLSDARGQVIDQVAYKRARYGPDAQSPSDANASSEPAT
jgi:hypothetical protein